MSIMQKFVEPRPYADPEVAARKLLELANAFEPIQDGPNLYREDQRALPVRAEGDAGGIQGRSPYAIEKGWLELHESGTFVRFTEPGAALFA